MSLNWRELELILSELPLEGSYIQKVTEHSIHSFTLSMYSKEEKAWLLYFEIATPDSRVVRTDTMRPKTKNAQRFTQYMRAHLVGRRIVSVRQLPFDRAFVMDAENSEDRIRIIVRLFSGIGANMIITDEDDTILELMYRRPQRGEEAGKKLVLEERGSEGTKTYSVREWTGDSFNAFIDKEGTAKAREEHTEELVRKLEEKRDKEIAALSDRLRRQEERIRSTEGFESEKEAADILSGSIFLIRKGMDAITLDDWRTGGRITIPLQVQLSPNENLERLYERYRKDKRAHEMAIEEAEATRREIEETKEKYEVLLSERRGDRMQKEADKVSDRRRQDDPRPGVRLTIQGFDIIIGRNAKENDAILRHDTRGSDLWMHTRDTSGAYVIIKSKKGKTVPLQVLLDAASLAIHYSKAKKNGKADLYYTEVKYLRRVKDGRTGLVIPTQERNLHAVLDEKRVKELLS